MFTLSFSGKTTAGMQVSLYRTLQKSALLSITFPFKKFCQFIYLENDLLKIKVNCNTVPKHSMDGQTWKVGDKGKSLVKRTLKVNKIWGYIGKINEMFKCVCKTEKASEQETNGKKHCGIFGKSKKEFRMFCYMVFSINSCVILPRKSTF